MSVYDDIRTERQRQDAKWGGPSHDDRHEPRDWTTYIDEHNTKATWGGPDYRQRLIEVAALAVAAIESHDRLDTEE